MLSQSFLATAIQVIVPRIFREDFEDIQNRFAKLFDEVAEILENDVTVTPERLKQYISRIPEMNDSLDNARTISEYWCNPETLVLHIVHISERSR